ncbi:DUF3365 domain-containing protein [Sulfuricurvum sp.]|uniref:Tll0287-like domain-containing protein n=1 Tax=Sulfuricurvum sp. TaxID=2025608 RepID=UPI002D3B8EE6|nr:DUF3365 domain-containing protein [Sulfuricurvum sp.]HZF71625.1 DUF3365 domain-containing protein [Sulfuricurvum sp.]
MNQKSVFSLLFISSLLMAEPLSQEQMIQKGTEVSTALVQKLGGELKTQMQSGGPLAALHFCSQNALSLTDQIAKESGTSVKRVSLQNRNPVNAATPEEKAVLSQWQEILKKSEALPPYKLTKLSNGHTVYYKPIVINNEACLKCHGDIAGDSPLAKAIKETYPEDHATGYKMGDLRGMVVVAF